MELRAQHFDVLVAHRCLFPVICYWSVEKRVCQKAVHKEEPFGLLEPGRCFVLPKWGGMVVQVVHDNRATAQPPPNKTTATTTPNESESTKKPPPSQRQVAAARHKRLLQTQRVRLQGQVHHTWHRQQLNRYQYHHDFNHDNDRSHQDKPITAEEENKPDKAPETDRGTVHDDGDDQTQHPTTVASKEIDDLVMEVVDELHNNNTNDNNNTASMDQNTNNMQATTALNMDRDEMIPTGSARTTNNTMQEETNAVVVSRPIWPGCFQGKDYQAGLIQPQPEAVAALASSKRPPPIEDASLPPASFANRIVECILVPDERQRVQGVDCTPMWTTTNPTPTVVRLFVPRSELTQLYNPQAELFSCPTCGQSFESKAGMVHHIQHVSCTRKAQEFRLKRQQQLEQVQREVVLYHKYKVEQENKKKNPPKPKSVIAATTNNNNDTEKKERDKTGKEIRSFAGIEADEKFVDPRIVLEQLSWEWKLLQSQALGPMYPKVFQALQFKKFVIPKPKKKKKKGKRIPKKTETHPKEEEEDDQANHEENNEMTTATEEPHLDEPTTEENDPKDVPLEPCLSETNPRIYPDTFATQAEPPSLLGETTSQPIATEPMVETQLDVATRLNDEETITTTTKTPQENESVPLHPEQDIPTKPSTTVDSIPPPPPLPTIVDHTVLVAEGEYIFMVGFIPWFLFVIEETVFSSRSNLWNAFMLLLFGFYILYYGQSWRVDILVSNTTRTRRTRKLCTRRNASCANNAPMKKFHMLPCSSVVFVPDPFIFPVCCNDLPSRNRKREKILPCVTIALAF